MAKQHGEASLNIEIMWALLKQNPSDGVKVVRWNVQSDSPKKGPRGARQCISIRNRNGIDAANFWFGHDGRWIATSTL